MSNEVERFLELPQVHKDWIEGQVVMSAYGRPPTLYATAVMTFKILEAKIPGDFCECGVAAGVHPAVMHYCMRFTLGDLRDRFRTIYMFDSYEGIPKVTTEDIPTDEMVYFSEARETFYWRSDFVELAEPSKQTDYAPAVGDHVRLLNPKEPEGCDTSNLAPGSVHEITRVEKAHKGDDIRRCVGEELATPGVIESTGITAVPLAEVQDRMRRWGADARDLHYVVGWFQNTVPSKVKEMGDLAILRLDGDLYESTKVCLEHLYPKVVRGGFVIVDDWPVAGVRRAVDEYFGRTPRVNEIPGGHGPVFWRKTV